MITSTDGTGQQVSVTVNGKPVPGGPFTPTGHILVYGGSGNDSISEVAGTVPIVVPTVLDGGSGNDTISAAGSSATNVLIGGSGNDALTAGDGRTVIIGGEGTDVLQAGTDDAILIGGSTAFDTNTLAQVGIASEWQRTDIDYNTRVRDLFTAGSGGVNSPFFVNADSVVSDKNPDKLFGGSSTDWFWESTARPDLLNGLDAGEIVSVID